MRPRLVAVDRDGTLIRWVHHLTRAEDMALLPGAAEAIARLNQEGVTVALLTNQSVVGRGCISLEQLDALHAHLDGLLADKGGRLDHYLVCPHSPEEGCACRKPSPSLLLRLMRDLGVQAHEVVVIGDTDSDMLTASRAGVLGLRVQSGIPYEGSTDKHDFPGLEEAVEYLLDPASAQGFDADDQ